MKRFFVILTLIVLFLTTKANAVTSGDFDMPFTLCVNNNIIETENNSYIIKNTAYAPIRFVLNALGIYDMQWKDDEKSVTFSYEDCVVKLYAGYRYAFVNDEKIPLDNGIVLKNDRTLAPVRFISELFGFTVEWNEDYYIADLTKDGLIVDETIIEDEYSIEDLKWLFSLIEAESKGEPFLGKIAVGNVVLNRVKDKNFPDTISGVIFDTKFGIQFQPVANNSIYNMPSLESVIAGKLAIRDVNPVGNSLYFFNPKIASSFWIPNNRTYYKTINNHDFYL